MPSQTAVKTIAASAMTITCQALAGLAAIAVCGVADGAAGELVVEMSCASAICHIPFIGTGATTLATRRP